MGRFQPGHKLANGGLRNPPGGRPTKEQAEIKKLFVEKYWAEVDKRLDSILAKYFKEDGSARDVVNRLLPYAKQGIEIKTEHTVDRDFVKALMKTEQGRQVAVLVTEALLGAGSTKPVVTIPALPEPVPANGNGKDEE